MPIKLSDDQIAHLKEELNLSSWEGDLNSNLAEALHSGAARKPEHWAENMRLSDQTGVPPEIVDRNRARLEKEAAFESVDVSKLTNYSPNTAEFLAEENNAALSSQKDIENLSYTESLITGTVSGVSSKDDSDYEYGDDPVLALFEDAWGLVGPLFDKTGYLGSAQRNILSAAVSTGGESLSGALAFIGSTYRGLTPWVEDPELRDLPSRIVSRKTDALADIVAGEDVGHAPTSAVETVSRVGGSLLAQILAYRINRALGFASLVGLGSEEAVERQISSGTYGESNQAETGVVFSGILSGAIQALPLDFILRKPLMGVKSEASRRAGQALVSGGLEGLSEWAAAGVQYLSEKWFTEAEDDEVSWLQNPLRTLAVAILLGGTLDLATQFGTKGAHGAHKDQIAAMKAVSEGASLDILSKASQESELRETHEESYRGFLQQKLQADQTPVYIDGPEMVEHIESKSNEEVQEDKGLQHIQEKLKERDSSSQDIQTTLTDYMTVIAPSNSYSDIRSHARTDPEGMSVARAQEDFEENREYVDELASAAEGDEEAQDASKRLEQVRKIEEMVTNQLSASGMVDRETAQATAQTTAAYFARKSADKNMMPMELYRDSGLSTEGPESTRRQTSLINIGLSTAEEGTGEALDPDEAIEAIEAEGLKVAGQTVRSSDTEDTLVVETTKPLTQEQGDRVSEELDQQAISQLTGEEGEMFGPMAAEWGPFDPDLFVMPSGRRASEDVPGSVLRQSDERGKAANLLNIATDQPVQESLEAVGVEVRSVTEIETERGPVKVVHTEDPLSDQQASELVEQFGTITQRTGTTGRIFGEGEYDAEEFLLPSGEVASQKDKGRAKTQFFSDVAEGERDKPIDSALKPQIPEFQRTIEDPETRYGRYHQEYQQHTGHFDDHIALSIPGYRDFQYAIGMAVLDTFDQASTMLDIGASQGSQAKTITSLSDGRIKTISLDPNQHMAKTFREISEVPGAEFSMTALGMGPGEKGDVSWTEKSIEGETSETGEVEVAIENFDEAGRTFDVVQESMVFQFIDNDRKTHISRMAELVSEDGLAIVQEKVHTNRFKINEKLKDTFKKRSFAEEDLTKKKQDTLEGMHRNQVHQSQLERVLRQNFDHVVQIWDSGNFKGYAASNSMSTLSEFTSNLPDTTTEFDTRRTEEGIPVFHSQPLQPYSESVIAYHFGKKPGLENLDPSKAGTGVPGPDTKKGGPPGKKQGFGARVNFVVGEPDNVPVYEDSTLQQVSKSIYRVKLTNLYNIEEDPLDIKSRADPLGLNADAVEEAVHAAGYDGIIRQRTEDTKVAYVFNLGEGIEVPVQEVDTEANPAVEDIADILEGKYVSGRGSLQDRHITDEEILESSKQGLNKLDSLLEEFPGEEAYSAAALAGQAKKGWYRQSGEAIAAIFGADAPRFTALLASLSPRVSVETNLANTLSVWNAWVKAKRPQGREEILGLIGENVAGKGGRESVLQAWENNAVYALTTNDIASAVLSGPKIQGFMSNLLGNEEEATLDAWMATFAGVKQELFSGRPVEKEGRGKVGIKSPGYLASSEKVRNAAAALTDLTGEVWSTAEVQETVWSWTKAVYESKGGARIEDPEEMVRMALEITDEEVSDVSDFATLLLEQMYARLTPEQREALENFSPSTSTGLAPGAAEKAKEALEQTGGLFRANAKRLGRFKKRRQQESVIERTGKELNRAFAGEAPGPYTVADSGNIPVQTRDRPLRGATLYKPTKKTKALEKESLAAPDVVEMPNSGTGTQTFVNAVREARRSDPSLSVLSKEAYGDARLFLSQDGTAGVAVKDDGEIVSLFGDESSTASMLLLAAHQGGSWISVYESEDIDVLQLLGFRTATFTAWDPDQKPRGWKVSERGRPDTLYMVQVPSKAAGEKMSLGSGTTKSPGREEAVEKVKKTLERRDAGELLEQNQGGALADINMDTLKIRLHEGANATSWLHEFGHFMRIVESVDNSEINQSINQWQLKNAEAVAEEAGAGVSAEEVKDYLATGSAGDPELDRLISVALQEQFARAWETYLMEGRAPSSDLRKAFRTFSERFTEVYKEVDGDLGVPMDDEIREIFDKMIAAADQIENMNLDAQYQPLFTDATMAGMTEKQWQDYQEAQSEVKDKAVESLREKLMKRVTRHESKKWNEEKRSIKDDLLPSIQENKVNKAREALKNNLKMDRRSVKEMVGEMVTNKKGQTFERVPAKLGGMTETGGEALTPYQAAAVLGYDSGKEMLQDVIDSPTAKQEAEQRAEAVMEERHGSFDEKVSDIVSAAMENEAHAKMLLSELKALNKRKSNQPSRKRIREMAKDRVAQKSYRELKPGLYRRAEIRTAKQAQKAWDKGKEDEAAEAKQQQLVNHYLAIEAQAARDEIEKRVDQLNRYRKKSTREAIQAAGGGHWDQIANILKRFEFRKSATLKSVEEQNVNIAAWSQNRIEEYGEALEIAPELVNEEYVRHWKDVPLSKLKGILGTIKNIEHVARRASEVIKENERVSHESVVQEIVDRAAKLPQRWSAKRTDSVERRREGIASKGLKSYIADQTKPPWLFTWLDSGERAGFFHSVFMDPLNRAYKKREDMYAEHMGPVMQIMQNFSDEVKNKHLSPVYIEGLPNKDKSFYGETVFMMGLNTGNQANLEKLIIGEGWGSKDDPASLTIKNPYLQAALSHLGEEEWHAIQNIWDHMELLYPHLKEVYEGATGKTLEQVETQEVETPYGTFRGGYFPLAMDRSRAKTPETQDEADQVDEMFSPGNIRQVGVKTGATYARTDAQYPLQLSMDVIVDHFSDTIHYIAYHDAIRSVNRLLQDHRVKQAVVSTFGEDEWSHLKPWLRAVATQGQKTEDRRGFAPWLRHARMGFTYGVLGFSYSTMVSQVVGLWSAASEVGINNLRRSLGMIAKDLYHFESAMKWVEENSNFMAYRMDSADRDAAAAMQEVDIPPGLKGKAIRGWEATKETGLKAFMWIQKYMVDLPTWYAAYIKRMEEDGNESKAIQYADFVVENYQGSGRVESMAHIMRDNRESVKMMTQFMTFFSSKWNTQRDVYEGARQGYHSASSVASRIMFLTIAPAMSMMLLEGELLPDEEEDETWVDQTQQILAKAALIPMATMPGIRGVTGYLAGFDFRLAPIAGVFEDMLGAIGQTIQASTSEEEEFTWETAQGLFYTGGVLLHIPGTYQIWPTASHLRKVMLEGEDLTFRELTSGPQKEE